MRYLIIYSTFILVFFSSCNSKKQHTDIDDFYTNQATDGFPSFPLIKPFYTIYVENLKFWNLDFPIELKYGIRPSNTDTIGINRHFIYGYINDRIEEIEDYEKGTYLYLRVDGATIYSESKLNTKSHFPIKIIDTTKNIFKYPQRWFVINAKDSTRHVFLSKSEYKDFLKENDIEEKTYNTQKMKRQYMETGILPWFPDSLKQKLSD